MKFDKKFGRNLAILSALLLMIPMASTWMFNIAGDTRLVTTYPSSPGPGEVQKDIYYAISDKGGNAYYVSPLWDVEFWTLSEAKEYIDSLNGVGDTPAVVLQEGSLTIKVVFDGAYLKGATVSANGEDKITNTLGAATFFHVPLGTLTFSVKKDGYLSRTVPTELTQPSVTVSKTVDMKRAVNTDPTGGDDLPTKVKIMPLTTVGGSVDKASGYYPYNAPVTVNAMAEEGYEFVHWERNGNVARVGKPSITVDAREDIIVKAVFRQIANPTEPIISPEPIPTPSPIPESGTFGGSMTILGLIGIVVGGAIYVYLKK